MVSELRHVPADWQIPWQWWTAGMYLAGFPTRETAIKYGQLNGWRIDHE